ITTFFASSVIGSPNGSAVWTVAEGGGVWSGCGGAEAGGAGDGLAAGGGAADGPGDGPAGPCRGAGGACRCTQRRTPKRTSAAKGVNAANAKERKPGRRVHGGFIHSSPGPDSGRSGWRHPNTRAAFSSHDRSVICSAGWSRCDRWPYKAGGTGYFHE